MTKKVYGQHLADAKQLLSAAKAIQADTVALGLGDPSDRDPERLRLLEAVAKAARVDALQRRDDMGYEAMTLAECAVVFPMGPSWRAVLEALAALEEYDE